MTEENFHVNPANIHSISAGLWGCAGQLMKKEIFDKLKGWVIPQDGSLFCPTCTSS